jgi:hypothetical protein
MILADQDESILGLDILLKAFACMYVLFVIYTIMYPYNAIITIENNGRNDVYR